MLTKNLRDVVLSKVQKVESRKRKLAVLEFKQKGSKVVGVCTKR
jgi:hypothetical protein